MRLFSVSLITVAMSLLSDQTAGNDTQILTQHDSKHESKKQQQMGRAIEEMKRIEKLKKEKKEKKAKQEGEERRKRKEDRERQERRDKKERKDERNKAAEDEKKRH